MNRTTSIASMSTGMVIMMLLVSCSPPTPSADTQAERGVTTFGADRYQSFIKNWDAGMDPVLYAVIQSTQQWEAVFHPAPVMGGNREFGPEAGLFDSSNILVVARVTPGGADKEAFQYQQLDREGELLILDYSFTQPEGEEGYSVKKFLGVVVPKGEYTYVRFLENGPQIGELDIGNGEWRIPQL